MLKLDYVLTPQLVTLLLTATIAATTGISMKSYESGVVTWTLEEVESDHSLSN